MTVFFATRHASATHLSACLPEKEIAPVHVQNQVELPILEITEIGRIAQGKLDAGHATRLLSG